MATEPTNSVNAYVTLGEVVGVHGVRGELKVHSSTRPRDNLFGYPIWTLQRDRDSQEYAVVNTRVQGRNLLARLEGVVDRDAALALRGCHIRVPQAALPPTEAGEYYWSELTGLAVETLSGQSLGEVRSLLETGANDVLVVMGDRERLIPYVPEQFVKRVDLVAGVIQVDWDPEF